MDHLLKESSGESMKLDSNSIIEIQVDDRSIDGDDNRRHPYSRRHVGREGGEEGRVDKMPSLHRQQTLCHRMG
jgi:hypothetical protein